MQWIARELGTEAYVNVMDQYPERLNSTRTASRRLLRVERQRQRHLFDQAALGIADAERESSGKADQPVRTHHERHRRAHPARLLGKVRARQARQGRAE